VTEPSPTNVGVIPYGGSVASQRSIEARQSLLRVGLYAQVRPYLSNLTPSSVLSISGADGLVAMLPRGDFDVETTSFPEIRMEDLPYANGSFDLVLSDQVLEHTEQPFVAMREAARVLKPGGLMAHTTCFLNPVHDDPGDYWRFTPGALVRLCSDETVVGAGGWGNRAAVVMVLYGQRRLLSRPLFRRLATRLVARNDSRCPVVTWVIATKP